MYPPFRIIMVIMFLSFVLPACKKHEPFVYPTKPMQQFEFAGLSHFKPFRLFTKTNEVADAALVSAYANEFSIYFYDSASPFSDKHYKSVTMVNADSLINTGMVPVAELKRTLVDAYDVFTGRYHTPVNDTNTLRLHIGKYKLHTPATTPPGYTYYELNDPAYIAKQKGDSILVPIIRYILISRQNNTFSFVAEKFNNVFTPTGISKLGSNDTLVVQSFDVVLKKK